jgi:hypothetical protein
MARPLGSKNKPKEPENPSPVVETALPFTGTAISLECVKHQGFSNYFVVTLAVDNGQVIKKTYSAPFALWEAIARAEMQVSQRSWALHDKFSHGKAWLSE